MKHCGKEVETKIKTEFLSGTYNIGLSVVKADGYPLAVEIVGASEWPVYIDLQKLSEFLEGHPVVGNT